MSWQPIETHPREQDERVLLWGKIKPSQSIYPFDSDAMHALDLCVIGYWRFRKGETDFWYACIYGSTRRFLPTHWKPLPPPPEAS